MQTANNVIKHRMYAVIQILNTAFACIQFISYSELSFKTFVIRGPGFILPSYTIFRYVLSCIIINKFQIFVSGIGGGGACVCAG